MARAPQGHCLRPPVYKMVKGVRTSLLHLFDSSRSKRSFVDGIRFFPDFLGPFLLMAMSSLIVVWLRLSSLTGEEWFGPF